MENPADDVHVLYSLNPVEVHPPGLVEMHQPEVISDATVDQESASDYRILPSQKLEHNGVMEQAMDAQIHENGGTLATYIADPVEVVSCEVNTPDIKQEVTNSPADEAMDNVVENALAQLQREPSPTVLATPAIPGDPFPCDHCSATFADRLQLAAHERQHGTGKPLPCSDCGRVYYLPLDLARHQRIHQPRPPRPSKAGRSRRQCTLKTGTVDAPEQMVTCGGCEEELDEYEMREEHVGYHWCGLCRRVFGLLCQLKRHGCPNRRRRSVKLERDSPEPGPKQRGRVSAAKTRQNKRHSTTGENEVTSPPKKRGRPKKSHLTNPVSETDHSNDNGDIVREDFFAALDIVEDNNDQEDTLDYDSSFLGKEQKVFPCDTCSATFTKERNLQRHVIAKHTDTKYECEDCDSTFTRLDSLTEHTVRKHKLEKTCPCPVCFKMFTQPIIAQYHFNLFHAEDAVPEESENNDGETKVVKRRNFNTVGKVKCENCDRRFRSHVRLESHLITAHKMDHLRYRCEECPNSYTRAEDLTNHSMQVHEQRKIHQCPKCSIKFTQQTLVNRHLEFHESRSMKWSVPRTVPCDKCYRKFRTEEERDEHRCKEVLLKAKEHPPSAKREMCDICGKTLVGGQSLRRHKLQHEEARPAVCEVCGAKFIDDLALRNHKDSHRSDFPHVCHLCGKGFRRQSTLCRHVKFHSDSRPHVCEHCGKTFKMVCTLTNHMRIHTGEKPFVCKVCGRPFRQSQQLKTHMKIHAPERVGLPARRQDSWSIVPPPPLPTLETHSVSMSNMSMTSM